MKRRGAAAKVQMTFRFDVDELTAGDLQALIAVGAVRQTRRTKDGRIVEYELTHVGRNLIARAALAASIPAI